MQDYKELYVAGIKLYGAYEKECDAYAFRVELDEHSWTGLDFSFSGAALFYFSSKEEKLYCAQLNKMYSTLSGECVIQDCEWGNTLKLYFNGHKLMLDGYFDDRTNRMLKFSEEVDQTIIPHIINLLRTKNQ